MAGIWCPVCHPSPYENHLEGKSFPGASYDEVEGEVVRKSEKFPGPYNQSLWKWKFREKSDEIPGNFLGKSEKKWKKVQKSDKFQVRINTLRRVERKSLRAQTKISPKIHSYHPRPYEKWKFGTFSPARGREISVRVDHGNNRLEGEKSGKKVEISGNAEKVDFANKTPMKTKFQIFRGGEKSAQKI